MPDLDLDKLIADMMQEQGGSGPGFGGTQVPLGYQVDKSTGQAYRITPNGLVPVGREELLLAHMEGKGGGAAPKGPSYGVSGITGRIEEQVPGAQMDFAGIDPREKYGNELQQTGFSNQMQQRAQLLNEAEMAQRRVLELSQMAERGKLDRAQLGESRANRAEGGRQANLQAAVSQWQTAMNLIPQMGQLSIQESSRVQDILSNGGDFLARAFESRGGTSPLGKITQADQINTLGQTMQTLRGMVQTNMQPVQSEYSDTSQGVPDYEAPQLPSQGFSGQGGGGMPGMPSVPNFQLSSAPQASSAPVGDGGGGGGFAAAPTPAPTTETDPRDYMPGLGFDIPPAVPSNTYPGNWDVPLPPGSWDVPMPPAQGTSPQIGLRADTSGRRPGFMDTLNPFDDVANLIKGVGGGVGRFLNPNKYPKGYDQGGFTTEPMFLGNEKGAELFVNPTNAPIQVVPADDTKQMGFSKQSTPGYDEGTSGYELDPVRELQMLQRQGIEEMGGYGMAAGSLFGGPSGGGGVNMGKGFSQKIDPRLVERAGNEFNAARGARRLRQTADDAWRRIQDAEDSIKQSQQYLGMDDASILEQMRASGMEHLGHPDNFRFMMNNRISEATQAIEKNRRSSLLGGGDPQRGSSDRIPGFATGTGVLEQYNQNPVNATEAIGRFNQGMGGFTPHSAAPPSPTGSWSLVNGVDPYANVGRTPPPRPRNTNYGGQDFDWSAHPALYAAGFSNEQRTDAARQVQGLPPLNQGNQAGASAYKPVSQQELIEMGRKNLPPAVADVLGGKQARSVTALESQAVPGNFLKTITARQMQGLSPEEMQALGTMTNTEFNAPLSYVMGRTQAQYGPSQEMRRGGFRGVL